MDLSPHVSVTAATRDQVSTINKTFKKFRKSTTQQAKILFDCRGGERAAFWGSHVGRDLPRIRILTWH